MSEGDRPMEDLTESAAAFIKDLFSADAGGHDAAHTLRVYRNTLLIAADEPDCDVGIASLAALLHDADDPKLFATENNANARGFLAAHGVPAQTADRICGIINEVSFRQNRGAAPRLIEAKVVQDADRLDAIGAVGIARTFAYGGAHGRPPGESIRHFYDKLLLLKDLMNTRTGRALAETRHDFLLAFLREYDSECAAAAAQ